MANMQTADLAALTTTQVAALTSAQVLATGYTTTQINAL